MPQRKSKSKKSTLWEIVSMKKDMHEKAFCEFVWQTHEQRTAVVRQSYGSRTNSNGSYDSRKKVFRIRRAALRIRRAAVRIRKTVVRFRTAAVRIRCPQIFDFVGPVRQSYDGRTNIVRLPCDLCKFCWDAAIFLRSACDLDGTNSQGKIYRTADVNKSLEDIFKMNQHFVYRLNSSLQNLYHMRAWKGEVNGFLRDR